jgi:acetate kinase
VRVLNILVLNSGSSSIKFKLFHNDEEKPLRQGLIEGIGQETSKVKLGDREEKTFVKDHDQAIEIILHHLDNSLVDVISHRVVHGGSEFSKPTIIDDEVIKTIDELSSIAPLHNPHNLAGILACKKHFHDKIQVAIFDTAFHQTLPRYAYHYAIPDNYYKKLRIRRYGFHGMSHQFVARQAAKLLGKHKYSV